VPVLPVMTGASSTGYNVKVIVCSALAIPVSLFFT